LETYAAAFILGSFVLESGGIYSVNEISSNTDLHKYSNTIIGLQEEQHEHG
jgi:hypothetical protein